MAGKPRANHEMYVRVLRSMTPERRLQKAFELSAMACSLFEHGLRRRFPGRGEAEIAALLDRCHNRNY